MTTREPSEAAILPTRIAPFTHVVKVGTNAERHAVFVFIRWTGEGRLSMSGVVGPRRNGNAYGACGQCIDDVRTLNPKLAEVWERWHLNDMRAGCEHQRAEKWGRGRMCEPCPTCGYRYGSAWLREEVPADVVQWLHDLPTSDDLPTAWWPR